MASSLHVTIVTPERKVYDSQASEVVLPAWKGEMGIYPDHDALLTLLRAGVCTVISKGEAQRFVTGRGFAEISAERVTILTDSCETPDQVDRSRAEKELQQAERDLTQLDPQSEEHRQAQLQYEHAQARLAL